MQRYISKTGESSSEIGCLCGNKTNCTNNKSVRKNAIAPIAMTTTFFLLEIEGVERIRAKKAIMVTDEPYKNSSSLGGM